MNIFSKIIILSPLLYYKARKKRYIDILVFSLKKKDDCVLLEEIALVNIHERDSFYPLQAQNICINIKSVHNYVIADIPQRLNILT